MPSGERLNSKPVLSHRDCLIQQDHQEWNNLNILRQSQKTIRTATHHHHRVRRRERQTTERDPKSDTLREDAGIRSQIDPRKTYGKCPVNLKMVDKMKRLFPRSEIPSEEGAFHLKMVRNNRIKSGNSLDRSTLKRVMKIITPKWGFKHLSVMIKTHRRKDNE